MAAVDPVASLLILILAAVALALLALGFRHRVAVRIGTRNAARARRRTALLVVGLLIGTSIIAGSLVVGDTIDAVAVHYTILAVGHDDLTIGNESPNGPWEPFPYSVYGNVSTALAGDGRVLGLTPEIVSRVAILDRNTGEPQSDLYLIGGNANQSGQMGTFVSDSGATVIGPVPGEVILDDLAASELNASAGDSLVVYGKSAQPALMSVQAVVQDNERAAFPTGGIGNAGSAFVDLAEAQQLEQMPGQINYLVVSLTGTQATRLANTPVVSASLNATLSHISAARGLTVTEELESALAIEEVAGAPITALFLILGLFSILAGALLIVGIFTLLAEERKGEMGLERALGMRRGELVYSFVFEGALYSAGSAVAGTAVGIGVGYGLTYAFSTLLKTSGLPPAVLLSSFTVTPDTVLLSYVAGFLLTLVTVVIASRRVSRLNIVRAIRDIPEPKPPRRTYTYLAVVGVVSLVLGLLLYRATYQGASALTEPIVAGAMILLGLGLIASRFVPNRIVFSVVGLALLIWGGLEPLRSALLGTGHGGGVYAFFAEGIILVVGAILLYAFNSATVASALARLAGGRTQRAPVAMIGLAYPGRRPGRTTVTLAIFALVSFTLVVIAGVGSSLDASLGSIVREDSGGYALIAYSVTTTPNLPALVEQNRSVAPLISTVVPLITGAINVSENGSKLAPYADSLYAAPVGEPAFSDFYSTNQYTFSATEGGMSAAQIDAALQNDPDVAIVDQSYSTVPDNLATSVASGHPTVNPGGSLLLTNPIDGNRAAVTVLGVMTQSALTGVFVGPSTAAKLGINQSALFLMGLAPGVSAAQAARVTKTAFFSEGLVVVNIEGAVASSIATTDGEIALLQIFVGLGLVVGIAAMGIVALRAVTERRREIGMLRANGFTEGMIVRAFLLEYSFVTLIGLVIGTGLGLLEVWNLTHSAEATATGITVFAIPWASVGAILLVAYGFSMLAVAGPSRFAARLPPAVAVRPSE
jgi:putative ABC transport system permease protein